MPDLPPVLVWTNHARQQLTLRCGDQADTAGVAGRCRRVTGKKAAKLLRRNGPVRADAVFHDSATDAILLCRPPLNSAPTTRGGRVVWVIVTVYGPSLRRGVRR